VPAKVKRGLGFPDDLQLIRGSLTDIEERLRSGQ
jgi:hypothetical protein